MSDWLVSFFLSSKTSTVTLFSSLTSSKGKEWLTESSARRLSDSEVLTVTSPEGFFDNEIRMFVRDTLVSRLVYFIELNYRSRVLKPRQTLCHVAQIVPQLEKWLSP